MLNSLNEKSKKDKLKFNRITNANLVCKDCIDCLDDSKDFANTSKCLAYDLKPDKVLNGGNCEEYVKEE